MATMPKTLSNEFPTSPAEPRTNTFFAFEPDGDSFQNPFPGARRLTLETFDGIPLGIEVVAGHGAHVEAIHDQDTGCCVYRWGPAAHPDVCGKDLLRWIAGVATGDHPCQLRHLIGTFVILIDDRRNRRVLMISDVIGMRPWYVGQNDGRLVCGSDVWEIQKAGFDMGGVNYDAVASWLRLIWDCSGQSLFTNFPAIGYGSIGTWEAGKYTEKRYFTLTGGLKKPSTSDLIDGLHQRVQRSFSALTRDLDRVNLPLSGGYDSRYMAALATRSKSLNIEAFCVGDRECETIGASMIAKALALNLQVLPTDGSMWNMFAEPYHFTTGGFPITKQVSHLVAAQRPGVPLLSGFFGDPTVRGSQDRLFGKTESETTEDLATTYQRAFLINHRLARFDLLDPKVIRRADDRILKMLRERLAVWEYTQHAFLGVTLFFHQRHFMGNNVAQLLHVTDPILPFVSWELIDYKMQTDPASYSYDTYGKLLAHFFPEIGQVPHNNKITANNHSIPRRSACITSWSAVVLRSLLHSDSLRLLSRRKAIPRLIASMLGRSDVEVVTLFLYRLHLLDDRLQRAGMPLDWNAI
jgi:hypothetical protein